MKKELCIYCNKEIYQEHTRYNGRYFHKETAFSNCLNSTNQATPNTFKEVSKEELESRRSSAYEYADFNLCNAEIADEIDKLYHQLTDCPLKEYLSKWFDLN